LSAELERLESVLTRQAAGTSDDHEGDGIFDSISTTFKQFIVHGKDWIGNAKNLVSYYHSFWRSSRSLFGVARPSVCLSSVTLVRPTQAVQIFGNISTALGTLAIH